MWKVPAKLLAQLGDELSAWGVALAALVAGGLLTGALAIATQSFYKQQLRQRFELLAGERYSRIAERFEEQEQRLDGLRRFFSYSNEITPSEFAGFARPLLRRTQAFSWAPRVEGSQRAAFERASSERLQMPYGIRDRNADGVWQPAPMRDLYYPVLYTQATSQQPQPFGFDLRGQPLRAATLARALSPGSMAVSAPLDMLNVEPGYSRGLLIVAPVFSEPATEGAEPRGYVMALLSLRQLINESLPTEADDDLVVRIYDLSGGDAHEVLFDSGNQPAALIPGQQRVAAPGRSSFQLDIRPSVDFLQSNRVLSSSCGRYFRWPAEPVAGGAAVQPVQPAPARPRVGGAAHC